MRWPWTRRQKEKEVDRLRAKTAVTNLDSAVNQLNKVLDRTESVLGKAEKAMLSHEARKHG